MGNKTMRMRVGIISAVIAMAIGCTACDSGGGGGTRCNFNEPPVLDESPDKWGKFRRDRQNTGAIVLDAAGYAAVAQGDPNSPLERSAAWIFPEFDAERDTLGGFIGSPSISPSGDLIYIGSLNGRIYGLRTEDDAEERLLTFEGEDDTGIFEFLASAEPSAITSSPLVGVIEKDPDDPNDDIEAVFIGGGNGIIFGVDRDREAVDDVWPLPFDTFISTSPTVGPDGTIFVGSQSAGVAMACPNGVLRFTESSGPTLSSAAVSRNPEEEDNDGVFYYGSDDGRVRAIREDGPILWTFSMAAPVMAPPILTVDDEGRATAVFVFASNGDIARLDADGRAETTFDPPRDIGRVLAAAALAEAPAGPTLYLAALDGTLHALDATTGARRWSLPLGAGIESSPAVVLSETNDPPIVVVGTNDGNLHYVADGGSRGDTIATYTLASNAPVLSSPAVGSDGTVFFGGLDGRVYAVR